LIRTSLKNIAGGLVVLGLSLTLYGCGGGSSSSNSTAGQPKDITITGTTAGVTPFIASVQLSGKSVADVKTVNFTIAAKPNTVSKPVSVTWNASVLTTRGYQTDNVINLPVFGLYGNFQNDVSFLIVFNDNSIEQLQTQISTTAYHDASGVYQNPTILKHRELGSALGYDFFILKSAYEPPVIVDTDGELRWAIPGNAGTSSYYADGQFTLGVTNASIIQVIQMDGTTTTLDTPLPQPLMSSFTHNIDPSAAGYLAEFNGIDDMGVSSDDIVTDLSPVAGTAPLQTYDMADIIASYMSAHGDDPGIFVRPGFDWFHVNAATYDPSDQTVIISSREDFLIKLNYATHDIVWILGDPTKFWYQIPSLRAKAITLVGGGDYPIGQHATSITSEGYLMVMNDGYGSLNQPPGAPNGLTRTFSEVSAYSIDETTMTATNVWNFDYGQSIFSPICGSSYQANGSYLVDFATASNYLKARLVGLDTDRNVVFDFQYNSPTYCGTSWNSIPIPMEALQIQ
jgi:arylsulfate sulfotransferase